MNGPEHYREAERLVLEANEEWDDEFENKASFNVELAKVHATLALAAATALWPAGQAAVSMSTMPELTEWLQACAVNPDGVVSS